MNLGVIPARLHSTRFPGKILASLAGKPLVLHVYERARQAQRLDRVVIAVDDDEVRRVLEKFGAGVVMTSPEHVSGSDRVAEVIRDLEVDLVVNIQGDEPLLEPRLIDELVDLFQDRAVLMATAAGRDLSPQDLLNPNVVKLILGANRTAADFQREIKDRLIGGCYRHIGLYAYRPRVLQELTGLPPSPNERRLRLEQYRALDHGIPIKVLLTDYQSQGVDTEEDLEKVAAELERRG